MVAGVLTPAECGQLVDELGAVEGAGKRGLFSNPFVLDLAHQERLTSLVRPHTRAEPFPVRIIYFDKSPESNWLVSWHQDLTIAVREKGEAAGFGPWSMKDGAPHVQPPAEILADMLTVRLHLDAADEGNGALRVIPGSHREGKLSAEAIQEWRGRGNEALCAAEPGDALLMRPLILHASGRSTSARHRRILHLEYASCALPENLLWLTEMRPS